MGGGPAGGARRAGPVASGVQHQHGVRDRAGPGGGVTGAAAGRPGRRRGAADPRHRARGARRAGGRRDRAVAGGGGGRPAAAGTDRTARGASGGRPSAGRPARAHLGRGRGVPAGAARTAGQPRPPRRGAGDLPGGRSGTAADGTPDGLRPHAERAAGRPHGGSGRRVVRRPTAGLAALGPARRRDPTAHHPPGPPGDLPVTDRHALHERRAGRGPGGGMAGRRIDATRTPRHGTVTKAGPGTGAGTGTGAGPRQGQGPGPGPRGGGQGAGPGHGPGPGP